MKYREAMQLLDEASKLENKAIREMSFCYKGNNYLAATITKGYIKFHFDAMSIENFKELIQWAGEKLKEV